MENSTQQPQQWYVVQEPTGTCEIMANPDLSKIFEALWGPFNTAPEAIAKRIGLIRAGKCRPN